MVSYRSALDQGSDQVAAFVGFCCLAVGKHTIINIVDVLNYGIGSNNSAVNSCGTRQRGREQDSGKASEMHVEDVTGMLRCRLTRLNRGI